MKKVLSLLLVIVILSTSVFMTSCGDKKLSSYQGMTPEEAYEQAVEGLIGLENYTITQKQTVTTNLLLVIKYSVETVITTKNDGPDFNESVDSSELPDAENEVFYVDEYFYDKSDRTKSYIPYEKASYSISNYQTMPLIEIPEEWIKASDFYSNADGEIYLKLTVDGDEYFDYMFESGQSLTFENESDGDAIYCIYFNDDGSVDRIVIEMKMFVEEDGMRIKATFTNEITFSDIGTTIVSPPVNKDDYRTDDAYDYYW